MDTKENPESQISKHATENQPSGHVEKQVSNTGRRAVAVAPTGEDNNPHISVKTTCPDKADNSGKKLQHIQDTQKLSGRGGSHVQTSLTEDGISSKSESSVGPCYAFAADGDASAGSYGYRCETKVNKELASSTASGPGCSAAYAVAPPGGRAYASTSSSSGGSSIFSFSKFRKLFNRQSESIEAIENCKTPKLQIENEIHAPAPKQPKKLCEIS